MNTGDGTSHNKETGLPIDGPSGIVLTSKLIPTTDESNRLAVENITVLS